MLNCCVYLQPSEWDVLPLHAVEFNLSQSSHLNKSTMIPCVACLFLQAFARSAQVDGVGPLLKDAGVDCLT